MTQLPPSFANATPAGRAVLSALWRVDGAGCPRGGQSARGARRPARPPVAHKERFGFTLIELILVMAILTMSVAVAAPALSHFFRGRTLDAEARRLLSLIREGQSRAVAEGVPVDLWVNADQGTYGLEIEPSYESEDPKKADFQLDNGLHIEVGTRKTPAPVQTTASITGHPTGLTSVKQVKLAHPELPTLRFLPDGSIDTSSPEKLRLVARDDSSLWLAQATDHLTYEIRTTDQ